MNTYSEKELEGLIIETTERIVIDYANFSGRESENRAKFRQETEKNIRLLLSSYRQAVREAIENLQPKEINKDTAGYSEALNDLLEDLGLFD